MRRASIAFALSAALLASSSPRSLAPEPQWAAFCYRGAGQGFGPGPANPLPELGTHEATVPDRVLLDDHTSVVLEEGSLAVVHEGQEIWRSDPSWDVRQLLVADVNDDGLQEVVFVLWKPFRLEPGIIYETFGFPSLWEEGSLKNHLFIYGWRDGTWQALWCSSPVADPITELAVGDIDGNGSNELVVLEGSYDTPHAFARRVSTWEWNGWGFTLQWRSPSGAWDHLVLQDANNDDVLDILIED